MASYPYLGTEPRSYPQYLDVTGRGQKPLEADPGEAYEIAVVAGWTDSEGDSLLPVPPGDGRWPADTASVTRRKAATV